MGTSLIWWINMAGVKKKIEEHPNKWHKVLSEALWAHRISKHGATKVTPFELIYVYEAVLSVEALEEIEKEKKRVAKAYNKRVKAKLFQVGEGTRSKEFGSIEPYETKRERETAGGDDVVEWWVRRAVKKRRSSPASSERVKCSSGSARVEWNDLILRLANIILSNEKDCFVWSFHKNGQILIKSMYGAIMNCKF
uniref:Retrotransposon protein, putative, unclassified n=2 Tax=Oryza sativa subsp. japonica TaxID=39947 RepID=Q2RA57_ORYSJ|nr:retrotransposon protein, putative, unclassified [Oryza sativa Japonica Group]ABA91679.1 retrotransposon protein, putative, unclassified [Oryza sativa Japonica Group]